MYSRNKQAVYENFTVQDISSLYPFAMIFMENNMFPYG